MKIVDHFDIRSCALDIFEIVQDIVVDEIHQKNYMVYCIENMITNRLMQCGLTVIEDKYGKWIDTEKLIGESKEA